MHLGRMSPGMMTISPKKSQTEERSFLPKGGPQLVRSGVMAPL